MSDKKQKIFKRTGNYIAHHASIKAKEIGFFNTLGEKGNTVVFKTGSGIYFNAYGAILERL